MKRKSKKMKLQPPKTVHEQALLKKYEVLREKKKRAAHARKTARKEGDSTKSRIEVAKKILAGSGDVSSPEKKDTGFKRPAKFQRRLNEIKSPQENSFKRRKIDMDNPRNEEDRNRLSPPTRSPEGRYNQKVRGRSHEEEAEYYPTTVFVGDIREDIEEHELERAFSRFGPVEAIRLIRGKCFAFIKFLTREAAQAAIAVMNGEMLGGVRIRVSRAKTPSSRGRWGRERRWETPAESRPDTQDFAGEQAADDTTPEYGELSPVAEREDTPEARGSSNVTPDMHEERTVVQYDDL